MEKLDDSTLAIGTNRGLMLFHLENESFETFWEGGTKNKSISTSCVF